MQEERDLTLQALAKSDSVFVGVVEEIQYGPETLSPRDRVSSVKVAVEQVLTGNTVAGVPVTLEARLHDVTVACFGNEAFWDDQVEQDKEYIFFVSNGRILSASPPARSWKRLGLAGQRELVLSAPGASR